MSDITFLRRREVAAKLAVSQAQVLKWERAGVLPAVTIPGIRAIRYRADLVQQFAENISRGKLSTEPAA